MFRYPDKPHAMIDRSALDALDERYLAQLKMDGWRCLIEIGPRSTAKFVSRHNKALPISWDLQRRLEMALRVTGVRVLLDAEWIARRPACREEALWIFDVLELGGSRLWRRPTLQRYDMLKSLLPAEWIVPSTITDYGAFFDAMQHRDDAEGIVLKDFSAPCIGSYRQSANNQNWIRCKWRAGEAGLTRVA